MTEPKELVNDYFAARERCDLDRVSDLFGDDVSWWVPQSVRTLDRPLRGRGAVLGLLSAGDHYRPGSQSWTLHHLIGDGEIVAVPCEMTATTISGLPYANDYVYVFRCERGKIVEVWEHLDTAYAFSRLLEDGNARVMGVPVEDVIGDI